MLPKNICTDSVPSPGCRRDQCADAARRRAEKKIQKVHPAERNASRDDGEQKISDKRHDRAAQEPLEKRPARADAEKTADEHGDEFNDLIDGRDDGRRQRKQFDRQSKNQHRRKRENDGDAGPLADLGGAARTSS